MPSATGARPRRRRGGWLPRASPTEGAAPAHCPLLGSGSASLLALVDERERALALVLLDSGVRLCELASRRVGAVGPDGTLHVMGKGAKERIVPIGASARRALVCYLATRAARGGGPPILRALGAGP